MKKDVIASGKKSHKISSYHSERESASFAREKLQNFQESNKSIFK